MSWSLSFRPKVPRQSDAVQAQVARVLRRARGTKEGTFAPLLDAKAAARLLGVPPTWLLAQARAGRIPHHRLGHYVRFSAEDLREWLDTNRIRAESNGSPARSGSR